jgi:hypothetical protein
VTMEWTIDRPSPVPWAWWCRTASKIRPRSPERSAPSSDPSSRSRGPSASTPIRTSSPALLASER